MPTDSGDKAQGFIAQYLREKGGRKVVALLQKAWKG
jgi:hypothetical protein